MSKSTQTDSGATVHLVKKFSIEDIALGLLYVLDEYDEKKLLKSSFGEIHSQEENLRRVTQAFVDTYPNVETCMDVLKKLIDSHGSTVMEPGYVAAWYHSFYSIEQETFDEIKDFAELYLITLFGK